MAHVVHTIHIVSKNSLKMTIHIHAINYMRYLAGWSSEFSLHD